MSYFGTLSAEMQTYMARELQNVVGEGEDARALFEAMDEAEVREHQKALDMLILPD